MYLSVYLITLWGGFMKLFKLCLMASLLLSFGACSKKTNSKSEVYLAKKNALEAQQALEAQVKAQRLAEENAIPLSDIIVTDSHVEESNLAFYQVLLAAQLKGKQNNQVSLNSDAGADHNYQKEVSDIQVKTNKSVADICAEILKKLEKKAPSDLVAVNQEDLSKDVEGIVECRSLNIKSNYMDVASIRALCEAAKSEPVLDTKIVEAKFVEVKQAVQAEVETNDANATTAQNDAPVDSGDVTELDEEAERTLDEEQITSDAIHKASLK